ncbi:Cytochrome c biogenesis protein transmembrane region [Pseudomonas putida]|uniref:Cytochrome c biogenesis protein transmembrane region n=1 Tax=Pseudomonas putida TaxID=303 RepID=A0A1L7NFS0_PSEPU|nr:Cytochrome c biogenesis protein transmembrane region [Pseudomonas putida]
MVLQALGGTLAALGLFGFTLGDPFLVALFVVHGFLHACAALRGRMRCELNKKWWPRNIAANYDIALQ